MTDLRKAAEMALKALIGAKIHDPEAVQEEIEALRQALNQPKEWKNCRHCGFQYRPPKDDKWHPLEQPEQEPVGWLVTGNTRDIIMNKAEAHRYALTIHGEVAPVYTTPPKREWVGLTDEEVMKIIGISFADSDWNTVAVHKWIREIEAKLKEKNT